MLKLRWLGIFCLGLLACDPGGVLIDVSLRGVTQGGASLRVTPRIDGRTMEWVGQPLPGDVDHFDLRLPPGTTGALTVRVQVIGTTGCQMTDGSAGAVLAGESNYSLSVDLSARPGCRIVMRLPDGVLTGHGRITSDPPGIDYPQKAEMFLPGVQTTLTLHADPDADSYLAGWPGTLVCPGTGDCRIDPIDPDTTVVTAALLPRRLCHRDHFCWDHPQPQGNSLLGLSVLSATDAWAVGYNGTVMHWNGAFWELLPSLTEAILQGVWARSAEDVWMAGEGGTLLRWDGRSLKTVPSHTDKDLRAVTGLGENDVWFAGNQGTLLHWDGQDVSAVDIGTNDNLYALWESPEAGLWVSGAHESLWHLVEGNATWVQSVMQGFDLFGLWGSGPNDIWAVGGKVVADGKGGSTVDSKILRYNGRVWQEDDSWNPQRLELTSQLWSVWGSGKQDVWTVGDLGLIAHYDGSSWARVALDATVGLQAVSGSGMEQVFAVGHAGAVLRRAGGFFTALNSTEHDTLFRVFGSGPDEVFAAGARGKLLRWDGQGWSTLSISAGDLHDVWRSPGGPNAGIAWMVGDDGIILCSGHMGKCSSGTESFYRFSSPTRESLWGIWGSDQSNIWAVGDHGTLLHFTGGLWMTTPSPTQARLLRVWGSGSDNVWAVGDDATVIRYDGTSWAPVPVPASVGQLIGVHGQGTADVWVVGDRGVLLHYTDPKSQPKVIPLPIGDALNDVWSAGPSDVWIVGAGSVIHHVGKPLSRKDLVFTGTDLTGIWGDGTGQVWAVGEGGAILRQKPAP